MSDELCRRVMHAIESLYKALPRDWRHCLVNQLATTERQLRADEEAERQRLMKLPIIVQRH